ncbi:MAG TPA: hypothetical protein VNC79_04470 [Mycobacteriales bacterium]|nr:hypothetical protein [Mycobacteriales bacterium]
MTEPPQHGQAPTAFGGPDPTRDIRLPPLTDRPASAMPREWAAIQPEQPGPDLSAPPPDIQETDEVSAQPGPEFDQPTDELEPPRGRSRERTIAFASPEMAGGRPAPTVGPTPRRPRRWPWVALALLPVVVIVVTGAWLFLLLRAA